jgi:light-regulated signal transduction histidine kinase (bacteriophytochrome)
MKPLLSESEDTSSLQALGRASLQIVHDLKNQLNGLKLYATFLRNRIEKSDRPADELETIRKLIAGIDRSAADLSLLSQYGQPIVIKKQGAADLDKMLRNVVANLKGDLSEVTPIVITAAPAQLVGEVDSAMLAEALKGISTGAVKLFKSNKREGSLQIQLSNERSGAQNEGLIEWQVGGPMDHDPFRSFAGTDEIRMSLAAKIIEAHGGSAEKRDDTLRVRLPLVN